MRTPPPPPPPPRDDLRFPSTIGILQKKIKWFIGVEVEQETSTLPPKKNPGCAPDGGDNNRKTLVGTAKRWPRKLGGGFRFIKGRVADTAGKPSVKTSAN